MDLRINPFNTGNPMTLKDAAAVATVVAFVTWILNFLASATIGEVRADVAEFVFEAIKCFLVSWAGSFITLAGLEQLIKHTEKSES